MAKDYVGSFWHDLWSIFNSKIAAVHIYNIILNI